MTRYQEPDTQEDRRRARRAHLVAGSFLALMVCAALRFHSGAPASVAPAVHAAPVATQMATEPFAAPLPEVLPAQVGATCDQANAVMRDSKCEARDPGASASK